MSKFHQTLTVSTLIFLGAAFLSIMLTYGGLLIILASTLAKTWSAVASLITFYEILVAPFIMGIVAYASRQARLVSTLYRVIFYAALSYFVALPLLYIFDLMN